METQDTSFKSREELLQWIIDKKPVCYGNSVYYFGENRFDLGYDLGFGEPIGYYTKHFEPKPKKKITLYRYTYKYRNGEVYQSHWSNSLFKDFAYLKTVTHIKTEQKEIEIEVYRE